MGAAATRAAMRYRRILPLPRSRAARLHAHDTLPSHSAGTVDGAPLTLALDRTGSGALEATLASPRRARGGAGECTLARAGRARRERGAGAPSSASPPPRERAAAAATAPPSPASAALADYAARVAHLLLARGSNASPADLGAVARPAGLPTAAVALAFLAATPAFVVVGAGVTLDPSFAATVDADKRRGG